MIPNATAPARFIGADVGKADVVVFDASAGTCRTLPNTPAALARFAQALPSESLVVCEATGGFEAALLAACLDAGRPVHRADARKVRAFVRSFGTLAKTDALDA